MKSGIGVRLAQFNIILTVVWVLYATTAAVFSERLVFSGKQTTDVSLFVVMWAYMLATPVIGIAALILGDRKSLSVRANFIILPLWLLCMAWLFTVSF